MASLNCDFIKVNENANDESNPGLDEFPAEDEEENAALREKTKLEEDQLKKLKTLFKGLKFFLNREVPREQFVFAIRAFSGDVSWEKTLALGATYQEDDETITHHVVDRPIIAKPYLNRYKHQNRSFFKINTNLSSLAILFYFQFSKHQIYVSIGSTCSLNGYSTR